MRLVYSMLAWRRANQKHALHIENSEGLPLCTGRNQFSWIHVEGEPTCKRCIKQQKKIDTAHIMSA